VSAVTDPGRAESAALERITPTFRPRQVEKTAPCQTACPNCGDIRGWIGTVAQREREEAYTRAWRMIADVNPFPSVLGRVCPHPCEEHCNRSELDEPLAINAMERFLGDWAIHSNLPLTRLDDGPWDEWVGVVGAGPSGLSFAYQMARRAPCMRAKRTPGECSGTAFLTIGSHQAFSTLRSAGSWISGWSSCWTRSWGATSRSRS